MPQILTFGPEQVLFDGFDLKYADTADLRGYIGQDIVQLGHYYSRTVRAFVSMFGIPASKTTLKEW